MGPDIFLLIAAALLFAMGVGASIGAVIDQ